MNVNVNERCVNYALLWYTARSMSTSARCTDRYPAPIWAGVLALTVFFSDISIAGTLLPFFIDDVLEVAPEWFGITITIQYAFATIGLFSTGLLADTIGLRKTLMIVSAANVILLNIFGQVRSITAMIIVRAGLGFFNSYALGLSWVSKISPRARLARWLSFSVCMAQGSILIAGSIAGALRGSQMYIACAIVSVPPAIITVVLMFAREATSTPTPPPLSTATSEPPGAAAPIAADAKTADVDAPTAEPPPTAAPTAPPATAPAAAPTAPAAAPTAPPRARDGLKRVMRTRYFWAVAFAPFVQGAYMGATFQTLAPVVLKETHSWVEGDVARMFQIGGLVALIAHATATPWLSSKPWRHHAVQAISLLNAALLVVYGLLGEAHPAAALILPVVCFVGTAICLGIVNFMVALLARTIAPEALAVCTGATRCLFTFGYCILPAAFVAMFNGVGLRVPSIVSAMLFVIKAALMQLAAKLPTPLPAPALPNTPTDAAVTSQTKQAAEVAEIALKVSQ